MPEIARFYGIIIRMYMEALTRHNKPHFHAYYQNSVGVIGIENIELLAGDLPKAQLRLTLAWAEIHQLELMSVWDLLQKGQPPIKIEPLN